ncbi:Cu-binding protein [Coemansia sp. RSA 1813]|nr:Cu-binding protein [Coemansia sp. RSA 1646]KAJ1771503.1 Cu-binding protein [Coemansia sp. RSA 1843]KAJ2093220.1 Cu-binding protein [Coemansia sp. RSA 986]KAJ2217515.1 Cu-binding protein [Coemansia sp. RSA 487]KAJ2573473.1 Cu-binding protein [Coemansia sp. RSA 1813]
MRAFGSVLCKAAKQTTGFCVRQQQNHSVAGAFSAIRSRLILNSHNSALSRRTYSTENPSSEKPNEESKESTDQEKPRERLLPATGPLSPLGIGLFVATAVGILYYFTVVKERVQQERKQNRARGATYGKADIGGPYELTDQDGNTVSEKTFRGKFTLVYFGFCHCPDICPDEMDKIGDAIEMLERSTEMAGAVQPIFITCDPQRDSPEAIKEYLQQFHPRFVGLTGTFEQVRQACKGYRVYFSKPPKVAPNQDYLVDHSIFSYFMDPDGEFIDVYGKDKPAEYMASDMKRRIKQFLDAGRTIEK